MKIVFMGTPDISAACLRALYESGKHEVIAVVTQPDKPAGRGKNLKASAVKEYALEKGILIFQPKRANKGGFPDVLRGLNADIFVVAAFGQILSGEILDIPKYGAINTHASLLPEYRGAAPIQQAILDGRDKTGITIMQMDVGMDTGDMLLKHEVDITPDDTGGSLYAKLCHIAPIALLEALDKIADGTITHEKQDDTKATYAPIITKEMAEIDWKKSAESIVNLVRGYNPFPGAYAHLFDKKIKVWKAAVIDEKLDSIRLCPKEGIFVPAGDKAVQLLEITPPNGKKMSGADFVRGFAEKE